MPLYLGCFPGRKGKSIPLSPSIEGRGNRQDDLGNKIACSLQSEFGEFAAKEEVLGLRLGQSPPSPGL